MIRDHRVTVAWLQETKLAVMNDNIISETLGTHVGAYAALSATNTRGGVLIACSLDHLLLQDIQVGQSSVTATIRNRADNSQWSFTGVYGPQDDAEELQFIGEIRHLQQRVLPQWLILGDHRWAGMASGRRTRSVDRYAECKLPDRLTASTA